MLHCISLLTETVKTDSTCSWDEWREPGLHLSCMTSEWLPQTLSDYHHCLVDEEHTPGNWSQPLAHSVSPPIQMKLQF